MRTFPLLALGAAGASAAVATYRWAPDVLFDMSRAMLRRASGLRACEQRAGGRRWSLLDGGAGTPMVLIHGFGSEKESWLRAARHLAPHHRLIIPDLPGFGDSPLDEGQRHDIEALAEALAALLDALGLGPVHLVGSSLGGYVSALLAARHPASLASLTLIGPSGVQCPNPSAIEQAMRDGGQPLIPRSVEDYEAMMASLFVSPPPIPRRLLRVLAERIVTRADRHAHIWDEILANLISLEPLLPSITCPALVLWGARDEVVDPSSREVFCAGLPDARAVLIDDVGHIPHIERPAETCKHLLDFLSEVEASAQVSAQASAQASLEASPQASP